MAAEVIAINVHQTTLDVRTRPNGKQHTTVTVKSEPVVVVLDDKALTARIAATVAKRIREQTLEIAETVSPATAKARRVAEKAFAAGKSWAVKRYSGGRTGATPPVVGDRAFNHSGRLANSIVAQYVEKAGGFVINYAANRWNQADWSSLGAMQAAFNRWVERVPALREPLADVEVARVRKEVFAESFVKGKMGEDVRAVAVRVRAVQTVLEDIKQVQGS